MHIDYYKRFLNFIPIALVGLLLITEKELETHIFHTSCQLFITTFVTVVFFAVFILSGHGKIVSFFIAFILWVILVLIKETQFPEGKDIIQ